MKQPAPFRIPKHIPLNQQLSFCLQILDKYRKELTPLRFQAGQLKRSNRILKSKLIKAKQENRQLQNEIKKLSQKLKKQKRTNHRYRVSLFDHGNFSKKKKGQKDKGGQPGHGNTNREAWEGYQQYPRQRLFFEKCPHCQKTPKRVESTRQKILLDIRVNPTVVKLLLQSERQWCPRCRREVNARHPQSLPFTEYSLNTLMVILLLRFRCFLSLEKIALVLKTAFGLNISKSGVDSLLKQSKEYLRSRYSQLVKIVCQGQIMYNDETGWLVRGKKAWLWIMANEKTTVYQAAESRGKGIFEKMYASSQAFSMHDGLAVYQNTIPKEKTMYCWAHFLRFVHEETHQQKQASIGVKLKNRLVKTYRLIEKREDYSRQKFKKVVSQEINQILTLKSKEVSVKNIQSRLKIQKQGLINALVYSPDGTNNLAERELRPLVIGRKISNGSDTFTGMETTTVLGSVIQTLHRQNLPFFPSLEKYIQTGVNKTYPYYAYLPPDFFDDS